MDLREVSQQTSVRRHPWEQARFRFFADVIGQSGYLSAGMRLLDAGAGDGWFARRLAQRFPGVQMVAWDAAYTAEHLRTLCPETGENASVTYVATRPDARFDVVLLLDVLEHVEADEHFLRQLVEENMVSGGYLLVSVPAWNWLYSSHDRFLRHYRRYAPSQLREVAEAVDLQVMRSGDLFHLPLALRVLHKLAERKVSAAKTGESSELQWKHGPTLTRFALALLRLDAVLSRAGEHLPWAVPGLSTWMLCRKR